LTRRSCRLVLHSEAEKAEQHVCDRRVRRNHGTLHWRHDKPATPRSLKETSGFPQFRPPERSKTLESALAAAGETQQQGRDTTHGEFRRIRRRAKRTSSRDPSSSLFALYKHESAAGEPRRPGSASVDLVPGSEEDCVIEGEFRSDVVRPCRCPRRVRAESAKQGRVAPPRRSPLLSSSTRSISEDTRRIHQEPP